MQRYFVSHFDLDTFVVIDRQEGREVCVCSNYEECNDAEQRAITIATLLNAVQRGEWN